MKFIWTISFFILFSITGQAQVVNSDYQKLFDHYMMDEFEDCLKKSMKFIEKDKHRRSPEPYIFDARSHVGLNMEEGDFDTRVDHIKSAVKLAGKYARYRDKTDDPLAYQKLYSEDLTEIKESAYEIAFYFIQGEKLRKANYYVRKVHKMQEEEPIVQVLAGMAKMTQGNFRMGTPMFEEGIEALKQQEINAVESETVNKLLYHYLRQFRPVAERLDKQDEFMKVATSVNELLFGEYADRADRLIESFGNDQG